MPRILILDDDPLSRRLVERIMHRQKWHTYLVSTAEDALECLRAGESFDLIVSDVILPKMNGDALAIHIHREFPQLPILFVSGMHPHDIQKALDRPLTYFLQKPFMPGDLVNRSREILRAA